jgi:hypothetical protein
MSTTALRNREQNIRRLFPKASAWQTIRWRLTCSLFLFVVSLLLCPQTAVAQTSQQEKRYSPMLDRNTLEQNEKDAARFSKNNPDIIAPFAQTQKSDKAENGERITDQLNAEGYLQNHTITELHKRLTGSYLDAQRLRKLQDVANNLDNGTVEVTFVNAVSGYTTIDIYSGETLLARRFIGLDPTEGLNIIYYDQRYYDRRDENYPLYRIRRGILDEVYRCRSYETARPHQGKQRYREVITYRIMEPAPSQLSAVASNDDPYISWMNIQNRVKSQQVADSAPAIHRELLKQVNELLKRGFGYKVTETFREYAGLEFKVRETLEINHLIWKTTYQYNPSGSQYGASIVIKGLPGPPASVTIKNERTSGRELLPKWHNPDDKVNLPPELGHLPEVNEQTELIRSTIETSWQRTITQYRLVSENSHVIYEEGTERRINTRFDGDEPVGGVIIDINGFIMADYSGTDVSGNRLMVPAADIFTPERLQRIYAVTRQPGQEYRQWQQEFREHLDGLGLHQESLLPVMLRHTYFAKGKSRVYYTTSKEHKSSGKLDDLESYQKDPRRTLVHYLLPIDPLMSRVIARESISGELMAPGTTADLLRSQLNTARHRNSDAQQGDSGEFILNLWWETGVKHQSVPFGTVPMVLTLYSNGFYKAARYEEEELLYPDQMWVRFEKEETILFHDDGMGGLVTVYEKSRPKSIGPQGVPNESLPVTTYKIESDVPRNKQIRVVFDSAGHILAEDYRHETVQPFRGQFNAPAAYSDEERAFFDRTKSWRLPTVSLVHNEIYRHTRNVEFEVRSISGVKRQYTKVEFVEPNGLDTRTRYLFIAEYLDDDLQNVSREDLPGAWLNDPAVPRLLRYLVIVIFLTWAAGLIARKARA